MGSDVITLFREYMGTGMLVIWFLVAVIYLWMKEEKRYLRISFLYMPLCFLFLYFNPLFARLVY